MGAVTQVKPYSEVALLVGPPDRYTMTVQSYGSTISCSVTSSCIRRRCRNSAAFRAVTAKATASVPSAVCTVKVAQASSLLKFKSPSSPSTRDRKRSRNPVTHARRRSSGAAGGGTGVEEGVKGARGRGFQGRPGLLIPMRRGRAGGIPGAGEQGLG